IVGKMGPMTAEPPENALGHAVGICDGDAPGSFYRGAGLRQERLGNCLYPPRRDPKPPCSRFQGEALQKGAVSREHGWLQLVQTVDDLFERLVDREQMLRVAWGRERLAGSRRDVRCLRRGHKRNHLRNAHQGWVAVPIPMLKAGDRRPQDRPRVPPVDEHATLAARTTGSHHVELTE